MILLSEGGVQECLNFLLVLRLEKKKKRVQTTGARKSGSAKYLASCGNRTCRTTASIIRVFALVMLGSVGSGKDAWPNVCPRAVVERFLLYVPTCES